MLETALDTVRAKVMTTLKAFTTMKTTLREEATIPMLAVDAFRDAFNQANHSTVKISYVQNQQLVEQINGQIQVIKDLSNAYAVPKLTRSVLKRKKKQEVMA